MIRRSAASRRMKTSSTSWKRRLARFKNRFPQLLRTDYWTGARRRNLWASLFAREKSTAIRQTRFGHRALKVNVESLEDRALLRSSDIFTRIIILLPTLSPRLQCRIPAASNFTTVTGSPYLTGGNLRHFIIQYGLNRG